MKQRSTISKHPDSRMTKTQQSDSQELSIREAFFVEAYVVSTKGNGAAAVREAGYSVKNPDVYAAKLLGKDRIRKAIARRRAQLQRLADVTSQEVISTLAAQMRGDITELLDENGNLDLATVRRRKLGALIKSISFGVSAGAGEARSYVSRVEMVSQQHAAIQLCKILHVERDQSDPTTLTRLLDERVAFAIEGFRRGGITLTRRDVLEMYAQAPESSGEFLPLILAELAAEGGGENDRQGVE